MKKTDILGEIGARDREIWVLNLGRYIFLSACTLSLVVLAAVKVIFPEKGLVGYIALDLVAFAICALGLFGHLIHMSGAYRRYLESKLKERIGVFLAEEVDVVMWEHFRKKYGYYTGVINVTAFLPILSIIGVIIDFPFVLEPINYFPRLIISLVIGLGFLIGAPIAYGQVKVE